MSTVFDSYILVDVTGLSKQHVQALHTFIEKFKRGALEHGDLQPGKDWTADMLDERIDDNFYAIFQLMEIINGRRSGKNIKKSKRAKARTSD